MYTAYAVAEPSAIIIPSPSGFTAAPPTRATPAKMPVRAKRRRRVSRSRPTMAATPTTSARCERGEVEGGVVGVDERSERKGGDRRPRTDAEQTPARDACEEKSSNEIPPGEHTADGRAVRVGDLDENR